MNKLGIWAIAIVAAFFVGILSANPVVEAVSGWKAAFDGLDTRITALENQPVPEPQVYEVSGVSIISANEVFGTLVELRCLDGDWFRTSNLISSMPVPAPGNTGAIINVPTPAVYHENDNLTVLSNKVIGVDARAQNQGIVQPFEFQVFVSGICLSPSP